MNQVSGCRQYAYDFIYDGLYLSDFGYVLCDFNGASDISSVSAGSVITFSKVSKFRGKAWSLTSTKYESCITATLQICKDPEKFDDMVITNNEFQEIMRWLNRREFLKFSLLTDDNDQSATRYYNASFNVAKMMLDDKIYGMELTMETDKPFAYGEPCEISFVISQANGKHIVRDVSDEIGFLYPTMKITCNSAGNLTIKNELENCSMYIQNCQAGETITIDGDSLYISSSLSSHKDICKDFNYDFMRIGNTYETRDNPITASLPCRIEISYIPIIKDAV